MTADVPPLAGPGLSRYSSAVPPKVLAVGDGADVAGDDGPRHLDPHQPLGTWVLMACLELRLTESASRCSSNTPTPMSWPDRARWGANGGSCTRGWREFAWNSPNL